MYTEFRLKDSTLQKRKKEEKTKKSKKKMKNL